MRIKIKHPDAPYTLNKLLVGLFFSLLALIIWKSPSAVDSWYPLLGVTLTFCGIFSLQHLLYLLRVRRAFRCENGMDVTALDFTDQGVSVYSPSLPPLFFPYRETKFKLTLKVTVKDLLRSHTSHLIPVVQITLRTATASVSVPHRMGGSLRRVLPLLDMRHKFASFSLKTEPLKSPKYTIRELRAVSDIRHKLEDYMQYGVLPPMSGDMRITFELFGLFFIGAAGYFYFKLFGLSAPDVPGVLILLLPFMGGAALLYAAAKDRKIQRRLEHLRGKKSKKD